MLDTEAQRVWTMRNEVRGMLARMGPEIAASCKAEVEILERASAKLAKCTQLASQTEDAGRVLGMWQVARVASNEAEAAFAAVVERLTAVGGPLSEIVSVQG